MLTAFALVPASRITVIRGGSPVLQDFSASVPGLPTVTLAGLYYSAFNTAALSLHFELICLSGRLFTQSRLPRTAVCTPITMQAPMDVVRNAWHLGDKSILYLEILFRARSDYAITYALLDTAAFALPWQLDQPEPC